VIYYIGLITIIGFVGPDISLKTQRDTFWITDQTRAWKRQQQDRMLQQSQHGLGSGTSFAAPVVAGQAALMLDESGVSGLQYWPMTVKAIIMATAWNNIEGDSSRSEFDGTGSVDVSRSVYVTRYDRWDARTISSSSLPLAYSIYAYAGERVRAAISWTSMPVDSNGDLIPESNDIVDIDLNAKDSSNRLLDASYSYRNNYEIVEFTAPYYGYYTINVRCIACPSFSNVELGFAYDRLY
jgi:subtilisin family serine protease